MNKQTIHQKVFKYHYDITEDKAKWQLTRDEHEAREADPNYRLSSLIDLNDWVAATSQIFDGFVATKDGKCLWVAYDDCSAYEVVSDWTIDEIHNDVHLIQ